MSFVIGQGAFTIFVVVLFGLYDYPPQISTGIVRVEDVALGADDWQVGPDVVEEAGAVGETRLGIGEVGCHGHVGFEQVVDHRLVRQPFLLDEDARLPEAEALGLRDRLVITVALADAEAGGTPAAR